MVPEKSEDLPLCFNLSFWGKHWCHSVTALEKWYHLHIGIDIIFHLAIFLRKNEVRTTSATARPTQEEALFYPVAIPR